MGCRTGVFVAGCVVLSFACSQEPFKERRPDNVLVVTIDTARADRFSFAGRSPVPTTRIDSIAADGAAFLNAVSPSPITLVSHVSLFTGQNPFVHGVRNNGEYVLNPEACTLAEVFTKNGWSTAAFIGAEVLDHRYGLAQGFGTYDDNISATSATGMFTFPRRRGDEVVGAALRWLGDQVRGPTFVWVHLYDPHAPYNLPEPEKSRYQRFPYDGAIAYSDRLVGDLLDGYRKLGRYEDSLVVVTSDHGESLGEHGENTHGVFIYDATVKVPLVMRGPGIDPGARVQSPVGLIDIMPTVLDLVGLEIPPAMQGESLSRVIGDENQADSERVFYVESLLPALSFGWSPLEGLRTERWKFIRGTAPELYDLAADPGEIHNVAERESEVAGRFSAELEQLLDHAAPTTSNALDVDVSDRNRLAALGYFSSGAGGSAADATLELPDPRERIGIMNRMFAATTRYGKGDVEGAIADLEAIVAEEPGNFSVAATLADIRFSVGDYAGAADAYGHAAKLAVNNARYSELEGLAFERMGRFEEGLAASDRALARSPNRVSSRDLRWRLLVRLDRLEELVPELKRTVSIDPEDGMARVLLAQSTHGFESSNELVKALQDARADLPEDIVVAAALAAAVLDMGDEERAEQLYRQVLTARHGDKKASLMVGKRALEDGKIEEARRILEAGVQKNPEQVELQVMVARARMASGEFGGAREALVKAFHLRPGWSETWLAAGELGILEGQLGTAAANLDRAAGVAGDNPDLRRRIADANRKLGRDKGTAAVAEEHSEAFLAL